MGREKGIKLKEVIREGEPTTVVLEIVKEERIDLIIMLAHEEHGQSEPIFLSLTVLEEKI